MSNEDAPEYAKALYELASNIQRSQNFLYAISLLERLARLEDPFYTPFAFSMLIYAYNKVGREDLEMATYARVTKLPEDQQGLLDPVWLASCHEKTGDLQKSTAILIDALQITPKDVTVNCSLAEVYLLGGKIDEAFALIEEFRARPEPKFQVLVRMIRGFILALTRKQDEAAKEFLWVGQFLISSGAVPPDMWDYRDLRQLIPKLGPNAKAVNVLIDTMIGATTFQEFSDTWSEITPAVGLVRFVLVSSAGDRCTAASDRVPVLTITWS